jgi:hypothetical protein
MEVRGGATEEGLRRLMRRCVVVLRTGVVILAGGAALVQGPTDRLPELAVIVAGLCAWTIVF